MYGGTHRGFRSDQAACEDCKTVSRCYFEMELEIKKSRWTCDEFLCMNPDKDRPLD